MLPFARKDNTFRTSFVQSEWIDILVYFNSMARIDSSSLGLEIPSPLREKQQVRKTNSAL